MTFKDQVLEKQVQEKILVTKMYEERLSGFSMNDLSNKYQFCSSAIYRKFKKYGFGNERIDHRVKGGNERIDHRVKGGDENQRQVDEDFLKSQVVNHEKYLTKIYKDVGSNSR